MKKLYTLFVLFFILSLAVIVNAQKEYQPFEWVEAELNGKLLEKVAMLLPVNFPGINKTFYMQFDTGCNSTFFYGRVMLKHGIFKTLHEVEQAEFSWIRNNGDSNKYSAKAQVEWSSDDSIITGSKEPINNIVGTIGCDMLRDKIMIIDFPRKRFFVLSDSSSIPSMLKNKINYSPMKYENDRLYINAIIGNDTLKDVFYDTGSSTTFLLLPLNDWIAATGKNLDDSGVNKTYTISWGDTLDNYKAPLKNSLIISDIEIPSPPIDYVDWGKDVNYRLIGNAPFYESYIVVLDCINNRFGLCERKDKKNNY